MSSDRARILDPMGAIVSVKGGVNTITLRSTTVMTFGGQIEAIDLQTVQCVEGRTTIIVDNSSGKFTVHMRTFTEDGAGPVNSIDVPVGSVYSGIIREGHILDIAVEGISAYPNRRLHGIAAGHVGGKEANEEKLS